MTKKEKELEKRIDYLEEHLDTCVAYVTAMKIHLGAACIVTEKQVDRFRGAIKVKKKNDL
jgi:hypothetical protein